MACACGWKEVGFQLSQNAAVADRLATRLVQRDSGARALKALALARRVEWGSQRIAPPTSMNNALPQWLALF